MVDRCFQALLIVGTIGFSWFAMMDLHESGHVLAAWITRGEVRRVVLPVVGFSRTDVAVNPRPLVVAWGGAVGGCLLPLMLLAIARRWFRNFSYLAEFFAGFCLIANGAYLAGGAWAEAGDARELLAHGALRWQLLAFGMPTVALGLWLWHGLGRHFGVGEFRERVDRRATIAVVTACVVVIAINAIIGGEK